jgi:hypothetical protein
MQALSLAITNFNNRIKTMNQTNSKQLVLSAEEARNLHADIFALLANITELQTQPDSPVVEATQISLDGGGFK